MKVLSALLTGILCAIYTFIIGICVLNNLWSSLLIAIGIFIIIVVISKLEKQLNKNHD